MPVVTVIKKMNNDRRGISQRFNQTEVSCGWADSQYTTGCSDSHFSIQSGTPDWVTVRHRQEQSPQSAEIRHKNPQEGSNKELRITTVPLFRQWLV